MLFYRIYHQWFWDDECEFPPKSASLLHPISNNMLQCNSKLRSCRDGWLQRRTHRHHVPEAARSLDVVWNLNWPKLLHLYCRHWSRGQGRLLSYITSTSCERSRKGSAIGSTTRALVVLMLNYTNEKDTEENSSKRRECSWICHLCINLQHEEATKHRYTILASGEDQTIHRVHQYRI